MVQERALPPGGASFSRVSTRLVREDYARYRPLRAKHEMSDDETLPGPPLRCKRGCSEAGV